MKIVNNIKTILRFQKIAIDHSPSYIWVLSGVVFSSAIQSLISVIGPKFILDAIFEKSNVSEMVCYIAAVGVSLLICNIGNALCTNKLHFISMKLKSVLKMDMAYQTTKIKYELLESPDILNIKQNAAKFLEEDVDRAIYLAPKFFSAFIAMLGYIYIISSLNIIILVTLFLVIFINSMIQSNTEKYS